MQYALMRKWLQHLTHTNIHISPEEEIPQGWDRAMCVWKTEHMENTPQHKNSPFKGRTMWQLPRGWRHLGEASHDLSHTFILLLVRELLDTRWCLSNRYELMKCHVTHRGLRNVILVRAMTPHSETLWEEKTRGGSCFHRWPPTAASWWAPLYSWV